MVVGLLSVARHRLGMELSWLARRVGNMVAVEQVDGEADAFGLSPGLISCVEGTVCGRVMAQRAPRVIRSVQDETRTADLEVIRQIGIGSYIGVPVVLRDGTLYGLLGCLSRRPEPDLRDRDAGFLTLLANVLADCLWDSNLEWRDRDEIWRRVSGLLDSGGPAMVVQPIVELPGLRVICGEALARFPAGTGGPEQWFRDAASVGLGVDLELAAIRNAFRALPLLPDGQVLAVNASPATVVSHGLHDLLRQVPAERIIVEVTEHDRIDDYPATVLALDALRREGARTAVDDVGAGYAGLHQLLELHPDCIKMDRCLTGRLESDPASRALAAALVHFAEDIGSLVLAEGVETPGELRLLIEIGVHQAQGFYLGEPDPLPLPAGARPGAVVGGG
ncbi:EAL domain-containing protein [Frankia sp. CNm7]|nr:EAL domain-containing protein [Frankia nepalensis]MBL7518862.1 EAL domain-containing protein [Frankia nepalensis]